MFSMFFTNNRAILLTPHAEFTESMLAILLHPEFAMDPPWLGLDKSFQNKSS